MKTNDKKNKAKDGFRQALFYVGVAAVIAGISMISIPVAVIVGGLFAVGTAVS